MFVITKSIVIENGKSQTELLAIRQNRQDAHTRMLEAVENYLEIDPDYFSVMESNGNIRIEHASVNTIQYIFKCVEVTDVD